LCVCVCCCLFVFVCLFWCGCLCGWGGWGGWQGAVYLHKQGPFAKKPYVKEGLLQQQRPSNMLQCVAVWCVLQCVQFVAVAPSTATKQFREPTNHTYICTYICLHTYIYVYTYKNKSQKIPWLGLCCHCVCNRNTSLQQRPKNGQVAVAEMAVLRTMFIFIYTIYNI